MTEDELVTRITQEVGTLSTLFVAVDYTNAIDSARRETGFATPNSNSSQVFWLAERSKRYLLEKLLLNFSTKFNVKKINLGEKFKHIKDVIELMDKRFDAAITDPLFGDVDPVALFGYKIDAGFAYDDVGRNITYNDDYKVIFEPTSEAL